LRDECVDLAAGQIEVVRSEDGRPIQTRIIRLEGIASEEEVGAPPSRKTSRQSHLRVARVAPNGLRGSGE
jgi:hypothetical protein